MKTEYSEAQVRRILKQMQIVGDTREQVCGHVERALADLGCPLVRGKLDQGDYTALLPIAAFPGFERIDGFTSLADEVVIERKANLDEIAGNFTVDRPRFEREFLRAKAADIKVFLLIENASWQAIWSHDYRSRLAPSPFAASLMSWQVKYNVTINFCRPEEIGKLIYGILYYWLRCRLEDGRRPVAGKL